MKNIKVIDYKESYIFKFDDVKEFSENWEKIKKDNWLLKFSHVNFYQELFDKELNRACGTRTFCWVTKLKQVNESLIKEMMKFNDMLQVEVCFTRIKSKEC